MGEFAGKVAIVTGAANGMGRVTARRFAEEGMYVVMADVSPDVEPAFGEVMRECGESAGFALMVDVAKGEDVENLVLKTVEQFGALDIMVNNAGIMQDALPVTDTTEDMLDKILSVNLKGVFFGSKYAGRQMMKQGSGTIVNIGSNFGKTGHKYFASYCASKAAVVVFTQALALELAPYGVTANAVCPGSTTTELLWKALQGEAAVRGVSLEEVKQEVLQGIPVGRYGTGDDIAGTILFLASRNGSFITGQAINVDGGVEVH